MENSLKLYPNFIQILTFKIAMKNPKWKILFNSFTLLNFFHESYYSSGNSDTMFEMELIFRFFGVFKKLKLPYPRVLFPTPCRGALAFPPQNSSCSSANREKLFFPIVNLCSARPKPGGKGGNPHKPKNCCRKMVLFPNALF